MYGTFVRTVRASRGLSQRQLAEISGIRQANLSAIENDRRAPSAATLNRLLVACGYELAAVAGSRVIGCPLPAVGWFPDEELPVRCPGDPPDDPPVLGSTASGGRAAVVAAVLDAVDSDKEGQDGVAVTEGQTGTSALDLDVADVVVGAHLAGSRCYRIAASALAHGPIPHRISSGRTAPERAVRTPDEEYVRVRGRICSGRAMVSGDEIRDTQRAAWAGLSASWEKWDSIIMDQLGPVGTAIIERLDIADDQQHLDIAAGTGEPGLTVAKLAPGGRVVLTDLAAEMLEIATRRASARGITNFETKVCSADDLPFDDMTFDSISVRFGYMFFPDLAKATTELVRVLKPGGRLCSSVWVKPEENPWTTIAMQAIATEAVLSPPDPDGPTMFRCAAPGHVSSLYDAAGLSDVAEWDVGVELVTRSPAQYWEMISEHVSLAAAALQQVDEPARERIAKAVIAKVSTYEFDGGVRIPGVARCIVGTK